MSAVDRESYDERYRSAPAVWSGRPNRQLVVEAADLPPGTALDAGCGEGADAIWLAERGWQVTAVDFSRTALERGRAHAETRGREVADRIQWVHADLTAEPPGDRFDLVSAQYMHLPPEPRRALFARLAAAVAPGGTLLVVGHDFSDVAAGAHRPPEPERFFTAAEVAGSLDDRWEVLVAEARPRPAHGTRGPGHHRPRRRPPGPSPASVARRIPSSVAEVDLAHGRSFVEGRAIGADDRYGGKVRREWHNGHAVDQCIARDLLSAVVQCPCRRRSGRRHDDEALPGRVFRAAAPAAAQDDDPLLRPGAGGAGLRAARARAHLAATRPTERSGDVDAAALPEIGVEDGQPRVGAVRGR